MIVLSLSLSLWVPNCWQCKLSLIDDPRMPETDRITCSEFSRSESTAYCEPQRTLFEQHVWTGHIERWRFEFFDPSYGVAFTNCWIWTPDSEQYQFFTRKRKRKSSPKLSERCRRLNSTDFLPFCYSRLVCSTHIQSFLNFNILGWISLASLKNFFKTQKSGQIMRMMRISGECDIGTVIKSRHGWIEQSCCLIGVRSQIAL